MVRKLLLLIFIISISLNLSAQKKELRLIQKLLDNADEKFSNVNEALNLLESNSQLLSSSEPKYESHYYFLLGLSNQKLNNFNKAVESFNNSKIIEKNSNLNKYTTLINQNEISLTNDMINFAVSLNNEEKYEDASKILYLAYSLDKKNNIDYLFYAASSAVNGLDYDNALEYYLKLKSIGYEGITTKYFVTEVATGQEIEVDVSTYDLYKKSKEYTNLREEITKSRLPEIVKNISLIYISGKMFLTLGNNNINVKAISQGASERNITAVIEKKDVKKALNILHEAFFEEQIKKIHLFIIGIGNVGGKFIEQISNQKKYLIEKFRLNINIIGISNSKKMFFSSDGILYENLNSSLKKGEKTDLNEFFDRVKKLNLRNSVFIDNTANNYVASTYTKYLKNNIGVVTCNKIACSDNYENYTKLKNLSKKYNTPFLFETNVGAGLPIIDTLNHLIASGDKIKKIQAILSGSLNFIFNNYNTTRSFRDVVYDAMKKGYTEPDPKIDLSGVDVSRKILILARECGHKVELEDVVNYKFLSDDCLNSINNDDLFKNLLKNEKHFKDLYNKANDKNCKLKYVANYENGLASVGLNEIEKYHDFYNIEGSDNIILFYTDRYNERPLIVKGAGAGAEVTASGIFADLIRISKN